MLSLISYTFDIAIKKIIEKFLSCYHFLFIFIYMEVIYF